MILAVVESLGRSALKFLNIFYEALYFAYQCIFKLLHTSSYNSATKDILVKQIYFTAVQVLPLLFLIGVISGVVIVALVVHFALDYGLKDHIGNVITYLILNEAAPLAAVLLIALRSGAAINTEIAVMKVSHELNTLKAFKIDIIEYLFLPRILAGVISLIILSSLLSVIMLISGYLYLLFFLEAGVDLYVRTIMHAISINDFTVLFAKSLLFGFFVILIPIYSGLSATMNYTGIPIAVLNGMVKIIIAIMSIEVVILLIQYL